MLQRLPPRIATGCPCRPRAGWKAGWLAALLCWLIGLGLLAQPVRADTPEITSFEVARSEEGVLLSFAVRFELPPSVEDALQKGVPLYFVAEAEVLRDRWYWFDRHVNKSSRTWRLTYQPLTRTYRITMGGLTQSFDTLTDALYSVRRATAWKLAEPGQFEEGSRHYVEFSYRLDTNLLPRPLQIGIGGQPDWTLVVEKSQRFN